MTDKTYIFVFPIFLMGGEMKKLLLVSFIAFILVAYSGYNVVSQEKTLLDDINSYIYSLHYVNVSVPNGSLVWEANFIYSIVLANIKYSPNFSGSFPKLFRGGGNCKDFTLAFLTLLSQKKNFTAYIIRSNIEYNGSILGHMFPVIYYKGKYYLFDRAFGIEYNSSSIEAILNVYRQYNVTFEKVEVFKLEFGGGKVKKISYDFLKSSHLNFMCLRDRV